MLERCNRICVTKLKHTGVTQSKAVNTPDNILKLCLHTQCTQSVLITQMIQTTLTDNELHQCMQLQHKITRHALPQELLNIQLLTLKEVASRNAIRALNCAEYHICFRCGLLGGDLDTKMRLTSTGLCICSQCKSTEFVFSIF